jgi:hypothetical protein
MQVSIYVAVRLFVVLTIALVVLISSSQSEAFAQDDISANYSAGVVMDSLRDRAGKPTTVATEPLPVSCQEAQAFAAQYGPREAVREARKRKFTWAQIKRVKSECFDRNA